MALLLAIYLPMRAVGGVLPGLNYGNFGHIGMEVGFVRVTAAIACLLPAPGIAQEVLSRGTFPRLSHLY